MRKLMRRRLYGRREEVPAETLPPELFTVLPNGGAFNRRAQPRSYALPDGTEVAIGDLSAVAREQDLLLNPFGKRSAMHRPIGRGAEKGLPGTTGPATRGRLEVVGAIRFSGSADLGKRYYRASSGDSTRTINDSGGGSGVGLPSNERMPASGGSVYYPNASDADVTIIRPSPSTTADSWFQFRQATSVATNRRTYDISGDDFPWDDGGERGNSASRLRFPAACLRGRDINGASPNAIRYALHVTATRHNLQGATNDLHVLGKTWVWPALGTDTDAALADKNMGDWSYGTRFWLPWDAPWRDLRELSGFNQRQKIYFDIWRRYGAYVLDGQGQVENGKAIMQVREDGEIDAGVRDELEAVNAVILPWLWPLRNAPAANAGDTERWVDGNWYAGGQGPLGPDSINSAWDAR